MCVPETIWEVPWWDSLACFDLDDEMIIFDRRSGHTHILDPVAAMVLMEIADQPCALGDLVALAGETFDSDRDVDFRAHVEMALNQLIALDLASRRLP